MACYEGSTFPECKALALLSLEGTTSRRDMAVSILGPTAPQASCHRRYLRRKGAAGRGLRAQDLPRTSRPREYLANALEALEACSG
jgi:hypothetical protein